MKSKDTMPISDDKNLKANQNAMVEQRQVERRNIGEKPRSVLHVIREHYKISKEKENINFENIGKIIWGERYAITSDIHMIDSLLEIARSPDAKTILAAVRSGVPTPYTKACIDAVESEVQHDTHMANIFLDLPLDYADKTRVFHGLKNRCHEWADKDVIDNIPYRHRIKTDGDRLTDGHVDLLNSVFMIDRYGIDYEGPEMSLPAVKKYYIDTLVDDNDFDNYHGKTDFHIRLLNLLHDEKKIFSNSDQSKNRCKLSTDAIKRFMKLEGICGHGMRNTMRKIFNEMNTVIEGGVINLIIGNAEHTLDTIKTVINRGGQGRIPSGVIKTVLCNKLLTPHPSIIDFISPLTTTFNYIDDNKRSLLFLLINSQSDGNDFEQISTTLIKHGSDLFDGCPLDLLHDIFEKDTKSRMLSVISKLPKTKDRMDAMLACALQGVASDNPLAVDCGSVILEKGEDILGSKAV